MKNFKFNLTFSLLALLALSALNTVVAQTNYQLFWSDEFDGNMVDTNNWYFQSGQHGWGNNEWQNYTKDDNAFVSDGTLKIIAKIEGEGQKAGDYTSARLKGIKVFTYGKYEVRAKIPDLKGNGIWPAIWMLGDNIKEMGWPRCGELDIMEYVSYDPGKLHFSIHSIANNHRDKTQVTSGAVSLSTIEEQFHIYGMLWTETYIEFYIDEVSNVKLRFDRPTEYNQDNWPFDKPFFLILNTAVGGDWGGVQGVNDSIFPSIFEIDYVRVYQLVK